MIKVDGVDEVAVHLLAHSCCTLQNREFRRETLTIQSVVSKMSSPPFFSNPFSPSRALSQSLKETRFAASTDEEKVYYLHQACRAGDDELLKAVLSSDPKPDINEGAVWYFEFTPLHFASSMHGRSYCALTSDVKYDEVVRTLMTTDPIPDVHKVDRTGQPASYYAQKWDSTASCLLLLDSRPSPE